MSDRIARFNAMCGGAWLVNPQNVNLDDFVNFVRDSHWNIGLVRVQGNLDDAVRFVASGPLEQQGCIAGWISDDEATPKPIA